MKNNPVLEKSFAFALKVVELYKLLNTEKKEFVMSRQLLKAGTSIGANIREADSAISKKEFIAKIQIALKEASETEYWLLLLQASHYLEQDEQIIKEVRELLRLLTAIIKTAKAECKYEKNEPK